MDKEKVYDLIIVGSGPSGLTSAVYASRYKLDTLIIGKLYGGLISEAHEVCNFPTYEKIKGFELAQKMVSQVVKLGVQIKPEEVLEIKKENCFIIKTNIKDYKAKKIILAIGTKRNKLDIKGEDKFLGKGVSYCATCDAVFYKDKIVAVVGGSDAALSAALLLSEYAKKVYIVYRKKFFRAEPVWVELVEKNEKIKSIFNSNVIEISGEEKVEKIKLDNGEEIISDGIFIEVGSSPEDTLAKQLGLEIDEGYISVNKKQETNINGIYAAGDVTNNPLKQVVTACAEGAIAANSVYEKIGKGE